MIKKIEGKKVFLAKAKHEDLLYIFNNFWSDEEALKYMIPTPLTTINDAKDRLEKVIEYQKNNYAYFIYEKESEEPIGMAGMKEIEPHVFQDSGVGMGIKYTGRRYGTEVLNLLLDTAKKLGCKKFLTTCVKENLPSEKLMYKCGFKYICDGQRFFEKYNKNLEVKIFEKEI